MAQNARKKEKKQVRAVTYGFDFFKRSTMEDKTNIMIVFINVNQAVMGSSHTVFMNGSSLRVKYCYL